MRIAFTHSSRSKDFAYKSEVMQLILAVIKESKPMCNINDHDNGIKKENSLQ